MPESDKKSMYAFAAVYLSGVSAIGLLVDRSDTLFLLTSYTCAFAAYLFLARSKNHFSVLLGIGLFARMLLFFGMPTLSDDIYRFIWDGTLIANGMNPYAELPGYYLKNVVSGLSPALFELLNSPDYFTIYPPLNQAFFWMAVELGQGSWLVSTNLLRLILAAADVGAFLFLQRLLARYGVSSHLAFFYFLNPLVVLEFTGNLHFEGLVVCFLLAGIYFFETNRKVLSATAFGLGVATKLLPLIYLPLLFLKGLKNKKWTIPVGAGLLALLTLLPMLSAEFLQSVGTSFDLYFHRFEFNASVYFLAREIGFWISGYNQIAIIGTILAVVSLVFILAISMIGWLKNRNLPETFLFILSAYLLFATTVHPWYTIPLIAFGLLSGYWYPVAWSFFIFLTYAGYTQEGFELPALVIVVEYVVVILVATIEIFKKMQLKKIPSLILLLSLSSLSSCGQESFDKKVKALYKNTVPLVKADSLQGQLSNVLLVDAREKEEYEVSHLQGARFVGYDAFNLELLSDVPKDQEIVVYCSVGVRSERVGEKLQEAGFTNVKNLYGGIFGWKNAGYEVVGMNEQPTDSVHAYNRLWGMWLYKGKKVY